MVDDGDPDGVRRYWFPAVAAGAQAGAEAGAAATTTAAAPPPA
jgi:hypothetical protein